MAHGYQGRKNIGLNGAYLLCCSLARFRGLQHSIQGLVQLTCLRAQHQPHVVNVPAVGRYSAIHEGAVQ